jgi:hypothetical protein
VRDAHGDHGRGTGRTTRLLEEAVRLAAEDDVWVTGAHARWLRTLGANARAEGLVGVRFVSPHAVCRGALRGARGVLLVDDEWDLEPATRVRVLEERRRLAARRGAA